MSEIVYGNLDTIDDFYKIKQKDGFNYEFIDGVVLMSPRPSLVHQWIVGKIFKHLSIYFNEKSCEPFLEIELKINNNIIIPDLSIICDSLDEDLKNYNKAPVIVIEIISPSNRYTDMFTKLIKYEMLGVKEYWIVDPKNKSITIYNFEKKINEDFSNDEIIKSYEFNDLEIKVKEIF